MMLLIGKNINLRSVSLEDAQFILDLRLDEHLSRHISSVEDNLHHQVAWIQKYLEREQFKQEYYFIIQSKGADRYGTVRLYDFRGPSFCWGSWILKKESPSSAAIESALLLYEFAFNTLGFDRSHFDVRKENAKVVAFHTRFGAKIIREDELNYYFHFTRAEYEKTRLRYTKYMPQVGMAISQASE
jgi:RimJ/RimL family protein N-acetyltransferase